MPFANLVRWSGPAAMVGGALWVVVFVLFALRPSGPELQPPYRSFEGLGIAVVPSLLLIVAGMVGLHARSKEAYGGLGTAGFVLAVDLRRELRPYARFVVGGRRRLRSENAPPLGGGSAVGRLGGVLRVQHRDFRGVVRGTIRGVVGGCRLPSLARHGI